jgi:hypothetical protein
MVLITSANSCVPAGALRQDKAGDALKPSQVYSTGSVPFSAAAGLDKVKPATGTTGVTGVTGLRSEPLPLPHAVNHKTTVQQIQFNFFKIISPKDLNALADYRASSIASS